MSLDTTTEWTAYDGVGPDRAESLRETVGSPAAFVAACSEPGFETYTTLDLTRLTAADGVGHELASAVVDQMVTDLVRGDG